MRPPTSSLQWRLDVAGDVRYLWERVGSWGPLGRAATISSWRAVEAATHLSRIAIDLVASARARRVVAELGHVERALHQLAAPVAQHPRFASYLEDPDRHAMVAMHVGVDLIRHGGAYYLLENNFGPSLNERRRALYPQAFDPVISELAHHAASLGFRRLVPISLRWKAFHLDEFRAAEARFGIRIEPRVCPLPMPGVPRLVGLPDPLEADTFYFLHSGLWTPVVRFLDNKWLMSRWLAHALDELPRGELALPRTREQLDFSLRDNGPRWPNLVVKLANSERSRRVVAARFATAHEAREALGLVPGGAPPRRLRQSVLDLLAGRDRLLFQDFIPPELDAGGRPQMIRLHMLVSPRGNRFLSAHLRIARLPAPERVPSGLVEDGTAFIFNEADYRVLPPSYEAEVARVTEQLGRAMHAGISRTFQTGPRG